MRSGKASVAIPVFFLIGLVIFALIVYPMYERGEIDFPNPFDPTYKPVLYTTFSLCKGGIETSPGFVSAVTDNVGAQYFGLWFGSQAQVRMRVSGPDGNLKTFNSAIVDVDWASCHGLLIPKLNPATQTTIQWKAWAGPGSYSLQIKLLTSEGTEYYPGDVKTDVVLIGETEAETDFPQEHEI